MARPDSIEEAQLLQLQAMEPETSATGPSSSTNASYVATWQRDLSYANLQKGEALMALLPSLPETQEARDAMMREILHAHDHFINFENDYLSFYTLPMANTLHQQITELTNFRIVREEVTEYDKEKYSGPAWIVLPWRDYQDYLLHNSFMDIDMGDYWFMNAWASPKEALCFRAYGEASCHQFPPSQQYVLMSLHVDKEKYIQDSKIPTNPKTSLFQRYGGGNDSLVFNMGSKHKFSPDEVDLHSAWIFTPPEALGKLREEVLCKSAFNHFHLMWSFSDRDGLFKFPDNSALCGMLQYYDAFLWLHVGATLPSREAQGDFINGFRWIVERPAYGIQETYLQTSDQIEALRFKSKCEQIGIEFKSYKKDFSLTEEDVEMANGLFTRLVNYLRCPSRSSGDLQMDTSES